MLEATPSRSSSLASFLVRLSAVLQYSELLLYTDILYSETFTSHHHVAYLWETAQPPPPPRGRKARFPRGGLHYRHIYKIFSRSSFVVVLRGRRTIESRYPRVSQRLYRRLVSVIARAPELIPTTSRMRKYVQLLFMSVAPCCLFMVKNRCCAFYTARLLSDPTRPRSPRCAERSMVLRTTAPRHRPSRTSVISTMSKGQEGGEVNRKANGVSSDRRGFVRSAGQALLSGTGAVATIFGVTGRCPAGWGVGLQPGERETAPPPPLLLIPALRAKVCVFGCRFVHVSSEILSYLATALAPDRAIVSKKSNDTCV